MRKIMHLYQKSYTGPDIKVPVAQIEWDIAGQSTKVILEMNFAILLTLWSGPIRMTNFKHKNS